MQRQDTRIEIMSDHELGSGLMKMVRPCRICDDFTFHNSIRFGLCPLCRYCQSFLMVALQNEERMELLECDLGTENCFITPLTRTHCPFCRFAKYKGQYLKSKINNASKFMRH